MTACAEPPRCRRAGYPVVAECSFTLDPRFWQGAEGMAFPMLDNGYPCLAASRLCLYRSPAHWGLTIETLGWCARQPASDLAVYTCASDVKRKGPEQMRSRKGYRQYVARHQHNEMHSPWPIQDDSWADGTHVARGATSLSIRG